MTHAGIPHSRPWITAEDFRAVAEVLKIGMISQGRAAEAFEEAIGKRLGIGPGVACASGTAALILGLGALGVRQGDDVILPTYVCGSVLEAVLSVGAVPRLCDVGRNGVVTPETVRPHVSDRTAAIVAVHLFGRPCAIPSLQRFNVPIIEDACQAFGLQIDGRPAGAMGDLGILSFHATKCLATGEGGMVVSHNSALMERARRLALGRAAAAPRIVAPLSDLQAALGLSQLARYPEFLARRVRIQEAYRETTAAPGWDAATGDPGFRFRYTVETDAPFADLQRRFLDCGVQVRHGVDRLLHRMAGLPDDGFPNAIRLFDRTVSIPFYPGLTDGEVATVCEAIRTVFR